MRLNSFFPRPTFDVADPAGGVQPPPVNAPWYQGMAAVDPEILGHWQNRGWHDKDAATIAVEATKAHRAAERYIGAPADQIVRLPTDPKDEAGWKAVWQRLGAPKDPAGYDFAGVKSQMGEVDKALLDGIRDTAAAVNLPKDAAARMAETMVKFLDAREAAKKQDEAFTIGEERATLQRNWGQNFEANKLVAQNAARALGIDQAAVAALEKSMGYAKVMEMFRNVGSKIGEDKFIRSDNANNGGVMTYDQALSKRNELMNDRAWVKRYNDGGSSELREMTSLNTIIASVRRS